MKTFFSMEELISLMSIITLSFSPLYHYNLMYFLHIWSINSNIRIRYIYIFFAWNLQSEFLFSHKFQNWKFQLFDSNWNNWFHDEFWISSTLRSQQPSGGSKYKLRIFPFHNENNFPNKTIFTASQAGKVGSTEH